MTIWGDKDWSRFDRILERVLWVGVVAVVVVAVLKVAL